MAPVYVRNHASHGFRSGEWALIAREDRREDDNRPTWLVVFPDGATDVWVTDDASAQFEFRAGADHG